MRTPSIERRFVVVGLAVVAVLVVAVDVLLYVSVRANVTAGADKVFDGQAAIVAAEARLASDAENLANRLERVGVDAVVIAPDGTTFQSDPVGVTRPDKPHTTREVRVRDLRVEVSTPSSARDPRLHRLLVLEAVLTPVGLLLAALVLRWIAEIATKPLDEIAVRARRTTLGVHGERLEPDRPDTRLGQMATTYDKMLDSLEGALTEAEAARAESERLAAQLESSLVALAAAAEEARESEARTRRFLDDAAHQLRSPITSIRACAETLQLDVTPDQRDRLLQAICRESERAGRLMAGLLRMARLRQEVAMELEATDVVALCERQVDSARLDSPHLDITTVAVGRAHGLVKVGAGAIGEILSNLVDNARRHARSRIELRVDVGPDQVELRVSDDGPGLPEGQIESVFERFVSLDNQGGSGLGLAIARELARAHGGDLTYEGRAFVLRVPCEPASPDGSPEDEKAAADRAMPQAAQGRPLLSFDR